MPGALPFIQKEGKMEKTKRKTAPKWGTLEWIVAHPYSEMDRKRRKRAVAVVSGCPSLKAALAKWRQARTVLDVCEDLNGLMTDVGLRTPEKFQKACDKAFASALGAETVIRDHVFGKMLASAWNLQM